jgi:ribonuclease Z
MDFDLTILGSNSAVPAFGRHPSCQVINHNNQKYMIDCGEGAQFQLSKYKVKRGNINHIFISHLHGDHYFGLVGLVNSFRLNGRKDDLHIYGPPKLIDIILIQVDVFSPEFGYKVHFHPLNYGESELIFENDYLLVYTIPLVHKTETNGFLFKEKVKPRKIIREKILEYDIPRHLIADIRFGADLVIDRKLIAKNEELTEPGKPSFSYAYCSDTVYNPDLASIIKDVTVLYHEATFMHDFEDKAAERYHSTTIQAAKIAEMSGAGKLLLGHFSARHYDLQPFQDEARTVFSETYLALEGTTFNISE